MPKPLRTVRNLKLYPSSATSADWHTVSAAVRNTSFFSACVEDERLLGALKKLVEVATEEKWSPTSFIDKAMTMLENVRLEQAKEGITEEFEDSYERLYNQNRLRLIYRTQREMADGYRLFVEAFEPLYLNAYPAWRFTRQAGAKEANKRPDHVQHEGEVRLKTDIKYWLDRNRADIGGFGNPYAPWGFNSWMRSIEVDRDKAEALGLVKPGEKLQVPPEYAEWNIATSLRQMGSASVADLEPEQRETIVERCKEENISVDINMEEETLQIVPSEDHSDPISELEEQSFEEWIIEEEARINLLSEDELLMELLGLTDTL